jgi:hypothetical protein
MARVRAPLDSKLYRFPSHSFCQIHWFVRRDPSSPRAPRPSARDGLRNLGILALRHKLAVTNRSRHSRLRPDDCWIRAIGCVLGRAVLDADVLVAAVRSDQKRAPEAPQGAADSMSWPPDVTTSSTSPSANDGRFEFAKRSLSDGPPARTILSDLSSKTFDRDDALTGRLMAHGGCVVSQPPRCLAGSAGLLP